MVLGSRLRFSGGLLPYVGTIAGAYSSAWRVQLA